MGRAYKCEVCGTLFEKRQPIVVPSCIDRRRNRDSYLATNHEYVDICGDCTTAIQKVVDTRRQLNRKDGNNEQAEV